MVHTAIPRPGADEHAPYWLRYIDLVEGDDVLEALASQIDGTTRLLDRLDESAAMHRYALGKWSVKQVVNHLSDCERVFTYRSLRIGRGDRTPLPGFDEVPFAENAGSDARPIADLVGELRAVRTASIILFGSLTDEALLRRGTANDNPFSTRALAWCIAGHELHHRRILIERYGLRAS